VAAAQTWLVVVTGLPGTSAHAAAFDSAAAAIVAAARTRLGVPDTMIRRLGGPEEAATTAMVLRELERLARRTDTGATVTVVLIGHGSAVHGEPRFHLSGPDLTAEQFSGALARLRAREVVVINAASASGAWVEHLAGPRRTIITATRSAAERDATWFPRALARAFAGEESDLNRDGRLSALELFEHARQAVERHYREARRLLTEHALIEADGDGRGSLAAGDGPDARRAALVFLDGAAPPAHPVAAALLLRRDSLYRELAALRERRGALDSAAYESALEGLAVAIARNGRALRSGAGAGPR
jgi:hypothetical protein